jgi:hypothetical protein
MPRCFLCPKIHYRTVDIGLQLHYSKIGPPCALANWGSSSWKGPLAVWGAIYAIYRVYIRNCFPPKSCATLPEGSSSWKIHLAKSPFSIVQLYQSKTISGPKNVSYNAPQLRPIIVKSPSAPSAEATHQIANRHYEEVESSCPDSQTLKNLF